MTYLRALLLALLLCAGPVLAADPVTPTTCGPADSGSPCGGAGPASQGNASATNQGAGNPINVITGNKHKREVDLPALPGVLGLEIVRYYNSALADAPPGVLGRGWRLSYETDLYATGNTLQVMQADGTRILFVRDPANPSRCATDDPARGTMSITRTPHGEAYAWTWTDGRVLSFNAQGRLVQIKAATGEFVSLTRDPSGLLMKVTDPQGRSLVLGYPSRRHDRFNGVSHIDSPVGRFVYAYGTDTPTGHAGIPRELLANLASVTLPDRIVRRYRYDDARHAHHLTALEVGTRDAAGRWHVRRLATWDYDRQGRGVLSVKGWPARRGKDGRPLAGTGIEQVKLVYAPGRTTLTNSLGQKTIYTHAIVGNEYRLLEVRGSGCASCGEANVKYGYDRLGRLTTETKLSPNGQPLSSRQTERDALGRPVRESRIDHVNGKAQPARLLARYEYADDSARPLLIARPSIVAGREAITRIAYNDRGQPLSVTESGFSPLDDRGQTTPTPIARTSRYAYRTINNRSLLTRIDGPLANGPKGDPADSDVTRLVWDPSGSRIVTLTLPGKGADSLAYDEAGRIARVRNAEGFATAFQYNSRNQVLNITSASDAWALRGIEPEVESFRYDALGNRIETGSGGVGYEPYRPHTRRAFDAAGRLLWQAEALGILKRARYDTEGRLLASTVQTGSFEQTERYRYDTQNRLIEVADNTGSARNVVYGERSGPVQGRVSTFRVLEDDFGREVRVASASHGTLVRHYDAADRLVEQHDDAGHAHRYTYDLAGRRVRHVSVSGSGTEEITTWRYVSGRLVEVSNPVQTERIRYNARGLPETRTVTLKLANGAVATHVTRYAYDAGGRLIVESLPDGSKILYERNGQGQVVAVSRQTSPWTLFGWGDTMLVKNLERDLIGLRHVTYGNGIQGQWQRSREGVLARVVYSRPAAPAADARQMAAASRAAVRQRMVVSILDRLLPAAHAQPPAPKKSGTLPGALGLPADPAALFDARLLYDAAGNVLLQQQHGHGPQHTQAYAYDSQSQLIAAQTAGPAATAQASNAAGAVAAWRYHYDARGNRVLAQENVSVTEHGRTRKAAYDRATGAMTSPQPAHEYVWDAQGRLTMIRQPGQTLAQYAYNHRGLRVGKQTARGAEYTLYNAQRQRVADLDAEGRITRQYLWLADQLIATLDARQPKALQAPAAGVWAGLAQTAASLWASLTGNADRLVFVHVNHLGAPVAASDQTGRAIWHADYAPYGQVISTRAISNTHYTLALRLPGQWEDEESGLYYNDARYYDPEQGRYLSPDPLGALAEALGSPNAYAYVNNNPASYIDPWGLILFAFDGTNNSKRDRTNVHWFAEHYLDNDPSLSEINAHRPYYIEGPGGAINDIGPDGTWDAVAAYTLDDKIKTQLDRLEDYVRAKTEQVAAQRQITRDNPLTITLDIVGFSRGAAAARDFANQVVSIARSGGYRTLTDRVHCVQVDIRFLGLFDTVLSTTVFPTPGAYNLRIPEAVQYAAQVVAVNEHRKFFPGESIEPSYADIGFSSNRIERGFVGAHSDIGGGYNGVNNEYETYDGGDVSDVALNWIVAQARNAGVSIDNLDEHLRVVGSPILHDERKVFPWDTLLLGGPDSEREFRYPDAPDGRIQAQTTAPVAGLTTPESKKFIKYHPAPVGSKAGTVDMKRYLAWLKANYGINLNP